MISAVLSPRLRAQLGRATAASGGFWLGIALSAVASHLFSIYTAKLAERPLFRDLGDVLAAVIPAVGPRRKRKSTGSITTKCGSEHLTGRSEVSYPHLFTLSRYLTYIQS